MQATALAGGICRGRACWKPLGDARLRYKNNDLTPDGIELVDLRSGSQGEAQVSVMAKGAHLTVPYMAIPLPVGAQLQAANGECWDALSDWDGIVRNDVSLFKGRGD